MRDPAVNAAVAAALEETRIVLGLPARLGALRAGSDPDADIRFKARVELTLEAVFGQRLSDDVRRYLYSLVNDTEIDLANEEVRLRDRRSRTANKGRRANTVRDQYIVDMVARIEEHGIKPTRNRDSRKKVRSRSGCDIVAQVLKELGVTTLSERTIKKSGSAWTATRDPTA